MKTTTTGMIFNILVKEENGIYIAHCLELDIVATGSSSKEAQKEIKDLILAQVDYAFCNDNLDNLYHPAPANVWKEYFECRDQTEDRIRLVSAFQDEKSLNEFVPPWIIAKTCQASAKYHA